ncbi:MAG TPA: hypothetical protein VN937_26205 [Blastocatellia bacterium]|nr:hypothetical protein [Blastocatellia bacterium]
MSSEATILMLALGRHLMWVRKNPDGGTTSYYYSDEITWIVGALAAGWLAWYLLERYGRAMAMRRPPRRDNHNLLKRTIKIKNELSSQYLQPGFSPNMHAVGIGMLGGDYCIQVFVADARNELWNGSGAASLPNNYRGVPLRLIEMPAAGLLSGTGLKLEPSRQYENGIRDYQEVIIGGISGANTNLAGQSGTIGYFCTRKSNRPGRKQVHMLSNSHVFADLRKASVDEGDLILQPSPGEPADNRPIGSLISFSEIKFAGDTNEPNHVDAAIARLWAPDQHKPVLPMIGSVKRYVPKMDIEIGEAARKFGRTTGYTEGRVFSIFFDIRVRYDRTGQSAFFKDQLLIEPALPAFPRFVAKGDSGSLVVDEKQNAIGLIFAGTSNAPDSPPVPSNNQAPEPVDPSAARPIRIEGYGVANPICEVLDRLKIELLI